MNRLKTAVLLAALTALFILVGQSVGGQSGAMFALLFSAVMSFGSYWFSDKIVLAMYRAQPISEEEGPQIYAIVRSLASEMNIPMPKIYLIPTDAPNAFATGRNPSHAAVAVTAGILRILNDNELAGVLAHELGHVINRDTLISTVAGTIAGALSYLARMFMWGMMGRNSRDDNRGGNPLLGIIGLVVAPIAAALIQMAISRSREFGADETGARVTRRPMDLASALMKLEDWRNQVPMQMGTPATAHLFIVNPFTARGLTQLFSTHPATEQRVARLKKLAGEL